jgi:xylose isomerase
MFGQFIDRYATNAYGPQVGQLEAIERAGEVGELDALDVNFPFDEGVSTADVASALERAKLRAHAITPIIYDRTFTRGSFTHPDPEIRRRAVDLSKAAIPAARELGARYVKFWPGQDGFDYPFQVDYSALWDLAVNGVAEVARSAPDVQFAIEYKVKEPRTHLFWSNAATTLLAIEATGLDNIGIVMDLGHSLFAKEAPAAALRLVNSRSRLTSIELNDNWREWDDDLAVGSLHLLETIEFLLEVRRIGWSDVLLLDQFPFREDPVQAARASIRTLRRLDAVLDRMDLDALRAAQQQQDAMAAQEIVMSALIGE